MNAINHLQAYARRIRELRRANPDVPEPGLAPEFHRLVAGLLGELPLAPALTIVPEFDNPGVGRPDIALMRPGQPARAFIELKAPRYPGDPAKWTGRDRKQYQRFRELHCWAASNFVEINLLERGEAVDFASIVPAATLRPNISDANADRQIAQSDAGPLLRVLNRLATVASQGTSAQSAEQLANMLAHSARLVREIVRDRLAELRDEGIEDHALLGVRQLFKDVLYSRPEAGGYSTADFDTLFSGAFAQTLAFGLLLVRESNGDAVGDDAYLHMPAEHPLMQTALRVLSQREVVDEIGIGFEVIKDTVNSFDPVILAVRADGYDPILYFYEYFLETFDPEAREQFGVYYTPLPVVRYMVSALDRALRTNLGTSGLVDPSVTILDPAAGTGTFLLQVAERVRAQAGAAGPGMASLAVRQLASRLYGLEMLVGPYAVAHYRLHHALRRPVTEGAKEENEQAALPRLGVYLADTLAEPGAAAPLGALGFIAKDIAQEQRLANHLKASQPILAIIGNPPYRRLEEGETETLVGRWMDNLWRDLKEPVRQAGQGNQLNTFPELSVAFWRWAIWKLFEAENAPRRGVVAFITNRKFLTGWPYAGLRKMLRERFDRIEIIDLRGDVRRGERAGVNGDEGVFNIMVGTAITVGIADGSKQIGDLARVEYNDAWAFEHFSRRSKFDWLEAAGSANVLGSGVRVERGELDALRPPAFAQKDWPGLDQCLSFKYSGRLLPLAPAPHNVV